MPYQKLSEKALAHAMAMLGFVLGIAAVAWHGFLGSPSMMDYMYPSFSFINPLNALELLAVFILAGYVIGYLTAVFYNWNLKRK